MGNNMSELIVKRRDPEPVITRLQTLVKSIKDGEIKLPNFQRPFVWQKMDILNLLDSIYRGYPIGSILLWQTTEKLSSERSIMEAVDFSEATESYQSEYLLDGQQRLTSVCGVLYWDGKSKTNKWNVYFDLDKEEFIYSDNVERTSLFPLNKLLETRSFLKECMKFEHHKSAEKFYDRAENLLSSIKDYKIAVVKIGDMKLEEVAPVFERINSRGRVLTMLDLMRAATWKDGFDLTKNIDEIVFRLQDRGFGEINSEIVLKCIAVSAGLGYNKADIDKLRHLSSDELYKSVSKVNSSLIKAFSFLNKVGNISDVSLIPFMQQIILLVEFFNHSVDFDSGCSKELKCWFWYTSISKYFSGASTGQNKRDLRKMKEFSLRKTNRLVEANKLDIHDLLFEDFNLRIASSSTMAALLNSRGITVDINGNEIFHRDLRKSKDFFKPLFHSGVKSRSNLSWVLCRGKKDLSLENLASANDDDLKRNFLNREIVNYLQNSDVEGFNLARGKVFSSYIEELCGIPIVIGEN